MKDEDIKEYKELSTVLSKVDSKYKMISEIVPKYEEFPSHDRAVYTYLSI